MSSLAGDSFPKTIPLPDGFAPEGIAIGPGGTFYVGSIPTGAIYSGSLRTGEPGLFIEGTPGRAAIGLDLDSRGRLFVAGGSTGKGFVYSTATGELLATYQLTTASPTFVNDVIVTREAAYFTDSRQPFLYRIPLGADGTLPAAADALPLTGVAYAEGNNANGIEATPDGKTLILVQSNTGLLFTVDPTTGAAAGIDLGGETMTQGDGILLHGRTLYVVRNRQNRIAVIKLSSDLRSGTVERYILDSTFAVPTTIDAFGKRLYAVNARFGTPVEPDTDYWLTQVRR